MKTHSPSQVPASLSALIADIEKSHHVFTQDQIERVEHFFVQAGSEVPDTLQRCFQTLRNDLTPHLMKEERILFPYITALELDPVHPPSSCFGSIANPIRMMKFEHDAVKTLLAEMRKLTMDYRPNPGAGFCVTDLYAALRALDDDLVEHMHWEDDVLFPRALQLEQKIAA